MQDLPKKKLVKGEVVHLDYATLENARYEECKLVYEGGQPPSLINVDIIGCEFLFEGKAQNTIKLLRYIVDLGDAPLVVNQVLGLKNWGPRDG
ncbi:hypothetical protein [Marinibacterium sp. SX1]|uniref:hypothetical protein n=1 Tax=Marinibacterium sp. SX1 TaxID=3388424 RepID=UPI003D17E6CA